MYLLGTISALWVLFTSFSFSLSDCECIEVYLVQYSLSFRYVPTTVTVSTASICFILLYLYPFLFHLIFLQRHLQKWLGENQMLIGSGPERLKLSRTADATCALPLRSYSPGVMQPSSCNIILPTSSASASITQHLYVSPNMIWP